MAKKKCPDPEAHENGDLLFPCDHFGAPITDKSRLDFLEKHLAPVECDDNSLALQDGEVWLVDLAGINTGWHRNVREAIDAAIRAERRAKKGE